MSAASQINARVLRGRTVSFTDNPRTVGVAAALTTHDDGRGVQGGDARRLRLQRV
ncbi:MAG: hypothetical protein O3B74_05970 [Proteobacteria bacterium]|nr:hypothetical protein [Pseudomonadota bacterium]MDA1310776.1 hypothetical protein [Pseudomonadota bacterium]